MFPACPLLKAFTVLKSTKIQIPTVADLINVGKDWFWLKKGFMIVMIYGDMDFYRWNIYLIFQVNFWSKISNKLNGKYKYVKNTWLQTALCLAKTNVNDLICAVCACIYAFNILCRANSSSLIDKQIWNKCIRNMHMLLSKNLKRKLHKTSLESKGMHDV